MRPLRLGSFASSRLAASGLALLLLAAACGQDGTSTTAGAGASTGGTSAGGGGSGGGGPPGKTLTIFEWNTHNFFDRKKDDPNNADEMVLSSSDYAAKRATIGAVIKAVSPDIAVLAEIENVGILDDLDKQELGSAYPTRILIDGNDQRGIDTGILAKIPIDGMPVSHKDEFFQSSITKASYKYTRDCLEVHFTYNGRHVIVLGVHFRSKGPPDDADKRFAEAEHTRAIADDLFKKDPTAAILITGDFNDLPGSPPFNVIQGQDPDKYLDSAASVPSAERYTYNFMGSLELIDHQMANPNLAGMLLPDSVSIKHGKDIDDSSQFASDHAPITAAYAIK
jgi:endonuclease/exonuclease/phosphatase family metal-dependent hydrolase